MSHEIPSIRFYYRREGSVMVLRSADPSLVVNVVVGWEAFEELRRRNPNATFRPDPRARQIANRPQRVGLPLRCSRAS